MTHDPLSMQEVRRLGGLCRINLSEEEAKRVQGDLEKILHHVDQLQTVASEMVGPYRHAAQTEHTLRPDEVRPSLPVDAALAAAPERLGDGFGVPKILD